MQRVIRPHLPSIPPCAPVSASLPHHLPNLFVLVGKLRHTGSRRHGLRPFWVRGKGGARVYSTSLLNRREAASTHLVGTSHFLSSCWLWCGHTLSKKCCINSLKQAKISTQKSTNINTVQRLRDRSGFHPVSNAEQPRMGNSTSLRLCFLLPAEGQGATWSLGCWDW